MYKPKLYTITALWDIVVPDVYIHLHVFCSCLNGCKYDIPKCHNFYKSYFYDMIIDFGI